MLFNNSQCGCVKVSSDSGIKLSAFTYRNMLHLTLSHFVNTSIIYYIAMCIV